MGLATQQATNLIAYDNFDQEPSGNLEGKEPNYPSGTTWAQTNRTGENGFKVNAGNPGVLKTAHDLERIKTGDTTLDSGCFALIGTTAYSTVQLSVTVKAETYAKPSGTRIGLLGRYVSTEKWLMAVLVERPPGTDCYLEVIKNVSGATVTLGRALTGTAFPRNRLDVDQEIELFVAANGSWIAEAGSASLTGRDSDLAIGGVLASGKVGLYDAAIPASAERRTVDGFQVLGAEEPARICYSGRQVEFNPKGCLRQDATGTYDGPPSLYRGAGFYLEPAGELGLINRVAVRMRRNDDAIEEDAPVTDKHSMEVKVRERFLQPR